ncbi:MAG: hypothetical protein HDT32_04925 [Clostridiales bacterium]|nr:hypothetical protein [Clostridiales bacterium]
MSDYKRMTERDEFGNADIIGVDSCVLQGDLPFEELNRVTNALNRFATLEEMIISGKLVELPETKQAGKIYYVCDRKACVQCNPDCNHTCKIAHAKNFTPADINGNFPNEVGYNGAPAIFMERKVNDDSKQAQREVLEELKERICGGIFEDEDIYVENKWYMKKEFIKEMIDELVKEVCGE